MRREESGGAIAIALRGQQRERRAVIARKRCFERLVLGVGESGRNERDEQSQDDRRPRTDGAFAQRVARVGFQSGLISTLRNLTTPAAH